MILSFIYPIYNRAPLFRKTLDSFLDQDPISGYWEIVVVDDGSTDNLLDMVKEYSALGLRLKYFKIDVDRLPFKVWKYKGANNPAAALNVGIKHSVGDRVVLSSPEVMHVHPTNVARLYYANVGILDVIVCDVWEGNAKIGGDGRYLHFLNSYSRDLLLGTRGFEERFMFGWAFEDSEFVQRIKRMGANFIEVGNEIRGEHLPHDRVENVDRAGWLVNEQLYNTMNEHQVVEANPGRDWGSDNLIVDMWP